MQIHLTEDTADFVDRLRKAFTSGGLNKRFTPQPKTSVNAILADFQRNNSPVFLKTVEPLEGYAKVSESKFPLSANAKGCLEEIGRSCLESPPDHLEGAEYQHFLETVLEKIVTLYRAPKDWLKTRRIVKKVVVKESFRKTKDKVAVDVPLASWDSFAEKRSLVSEDEILAAMDDHIKRFCGLGGQKLRAFVDSKSHAIGETKSLLKTCESHFAVLEVGRPIKQVLDEGIQERFEASVVTLLLSDLPPDLQP